MFYTNRSFLDTYIGTEPAKRYAFWYARYADRYDGTPCGIWQYTSSGRVDGVGTHDELLATNEIYRSVFESQAEGTGDFDVHAAQDEFAAGFEPVRIVTVANAQLHAGLLQKLLTDKISVCRLRDLDVGGGALDDGGFSAREPNGA